jgi:hypothetical protein
MNLIKRMERRGNVDGFNVSGTQYTNEKGEIAWWILVGLSTGNASSYWVVDEEFYQCQSSFGDIEPNTNVHFTSEETIYVTEPERAAVLKKIAEWDKEKI